MTEREFRQHVADLDDCPDPLDRIAHHAQCIAVCMNVMTGLVGRPVFSGKTLIPWAKVEDGAELSEAEVQMLETAFPLASDAVQVTLSEEDVAMLNRYYGK